MFVLFSLPIQAPEDRMCCVNMRLMNYLDYAPPTFLLINTFYRMSSGNRAQC